MITLDKNNVGMATVGIAFCAICPCYVYGEPRDNCTRDYGCTCAPDYLMRIQAKSAAVVMLQHPCGNHAYIDPANKTLFPVRGAVIVPEERAKALRGMGFRTGSLWFNEYATRDENDYGDPE